MADYIQIASIKWEKPALHFSVPLGFSDTRTTFECTHNIQARAELIHKRATNVLKQASSLVWVKEIPLQVEIRACALGLHGSRNIIRSGFWLRLRYGSRLKLSIKKRRKQPLAAAYTCQDPPLPDAVINTKYESIVRYLIGGTWGS